MNQIYTVLLIIVNLLRVLSKILYYIGEAIYKLFVPMKEKNVKGEIVLITGAGHGIGRELALKYASLGAIVVCWDINQEFNQETITKIKEMGDTSAYAYKCDISKREEVLRVAEKVKEEIGDVTILINNAGIMPCHTFLNYTPEEIRNTFDINVLAHFWILEAFLPSMIEKNYGHIVAICSLVGMIAMPNLVPYSASKFAIRGLMEALYIELKAREEETSNINLTTIYPYIVDTGLCKKTTIKYESIFSMLPPKEVANLVVKAQRMNYLNISIPRYFSSMNAVIRNLPEKAQIYFRDFCGVTVEPN